VPCRVGGWLWRIYLCVFYRLAGRCCMCSEINKPFWIYKKGMNNIVLHLSHIDVFGNY